jgi:hypothetical protein
MMTDNQVKVDVLNDEEAWLLFSRMQGMWLLRNVSNHLQEQLLKDVVVCLWPSSPWEL